MLIDRTRDSDRLSRLLELFPVIAIIGARQCGKTTLARTLGADHYFDLENPRDLARLENPQLTLEKLTGLIVIDEIQRMPDVFPLLRFLIDTMPEQKYLILGSASRELLSRGRESLAGRIAYYPLGGFTAAEIKDIDKVWLRGGFPRATLAVNDKAAFTWLEQYVATYMERDIPQLGINIAARTLRRFWTMLSHYHGQILNYSELGNSFGISDMTVRRYVDILASTFMIRILPPWHANLSKRLVKRPKIYLRDSGLFHYFMTVASLAQLQAHPKLGSSWEGFALEYACRQLGKAEEEYYFWRTHAGAELDLFWQAQGKNWGIEFKYTDAPRRSRSMLSALADLQLEHLWVVYPGTKQYRLDAKITALPLSGLEEVMRD